MKVAPRPIRASGEAEGPERQSGELLHRQIEKSLNVDEHHRRAPGPAGPSHEGQGARPAGSRIPVGIRGVGPSMGLGAESPDNRADLLVGEVSREVTQGHVGPRWEGNHSQRARRAQEGNRGDAQGDPMTAVTPLPVGPDGRRIKEE